MTYSNSLRSVLLLLLFDATIVIVCGQFTAQTYPDPRNEPLRCKLILPGQVCDPNNILTDDNRQKLNEKIQHLQSVTAQIKNSSPQCAGNPNQNLQIVTALLEKIGSSPFESVDIEKFTNSLRLKYSNFQDLSCDTLVLIVNSRRDRQVFTVAGRDAKLSRDVLQTAFHRNIGHFRANRYAMGLEGMVEYLVSAYSSAHIVQVPTPESLGPTSSNVESFVVHGVRQKPEQKVSGFEQIPIEKLDLSVVPDKDKIWVQLIHKAASRCGYDKTKIAENVRAVVEGLKVATSFDLKKEFLEAMSFSLKLISDKRYNAIEEASQDFSTSSNPRVDAWADAKTNFIDDLYAQYRESFPRRASQCPELDSSSNDPPTPFLG